MWLRQMVGVRAAAISGDTEIGIGLLQTKYRGTFAKRQSRPRGIEGAALLRRGRAETIKACKDQLRQGIIPSGQDAARTAGTNHLTGKAQRVCSGRARVRDDANGRA